MKQKRSDDKEWFKDIFNSHFEYIRNYLYYLSGDMDMAEDLVQDLFLILWEKREHIADSTVRSYLFTMARNHFLKNRREAKSALKFRSTLLEQQDDKSPEYLLEMQEYDKRLQRVIADMSEKSRTVFLMNRIDGMTYNEIAESLQVSVKAIEKQMSKALLHLKKNLGEKM